MEHLKYNYDYHRTFASFGIKYSTRSWYADKPNQTKVDFLGMTLDYIQ